MLEKRVTPKPFSKIDVLLILIAIICVFLIFLDNHRYIVYNGFIMILAGIFFSLRVFHYRKYGKDKYFYFHLFLAMFYYLGGAVSIALKFIY